MLLSGDIDLKIIEPDFQILEDTVNFRNHVDCAGGGDAEKHVAAFQLERIFNVDQAGQSKKYDQRRDAGDAIQAASGAHADSGFNEDCGSGGHADDTAAFAEN